MARSNVAFLALLAVLGSVATVSAFTWRPSPIDPIMYTVPKNWSTTSVSECPSDCKTCCKDAYSQISWVLGSMPKSNCTFCQNLRYLLGRYDPNKEETKCPDCLMKDFKKVAWHFQCANDFGRCTKCCMDLTLVYIARYVANCPEEVWRQVQAVQYRDIGFSYDGSSSCPPPPSPSPNPDAPVHHYGAPKAPTHDESVGTPLGQTEEYDDDPAINMDDVGVGMGI
jgi:hypothetical protein